MPVLGQTSVFPDASDIVVILDQGITRWKMPVAYIFYVQRDLGAAEVDIVEGSVAMPQWGQG